MNKALIFGLLLVGLILVESNGNGGRANRMGGCSNCGSSGGSWGSNGRGI